MAEKLMAVRLTDHPFTIPVLEAMLGVAFFPCGNMTGQTRNPALSFLGRVFLCLAAGG